MEYNFDEIKKTVDEWDTIICSLSTSKKNGKIINRIIWVKRDSPEKCINSFLDKLQESNPNKKREKVTNYILGKVDLRGIPLRECRANMIRLMEYLPTGQIGEVVEFLCDENNIYKISRKYNLFLGTGLEEYDNKNT